MSCEHLVCANCAGPVVEGRCSVCRAARAEVHERHPFGLTPQMLVVLAAVALLLALVVAHYQM